MRKQIKGAIIGFVLFAGVSWAVSSLYYRFMPGNWFINYYQAQIIDSTVGSDLQGTFCRVVRAENLRINATRTFLINKDGKMVAMGEYEFSAGVEKLKDTNCQPIRVIADNVPDVAGEYKIHTEADFVVNGVRKTISYDTNTFKITETKESLQQEIDRLREQVKDNQERIKQLEEQLGQTSAVKPTTVAPSPNQDAVTTKPLAPAPPQATPSEPNKPVDQGFIPDNIPILGPLL